MHLCVYNCIHMCNGIFYRRYGYACPIHINAQTCILTYTYDHTDERTSPLLGLPKLKRNKEMQPVLFCKYVEKHARICELYINQCTMRFWKNQYICMFYLHSALLFREAEATRTNQYIGIRFYVDCWWYLPEFRYLYKYIACIPNACPLY